MKFIKPISIKELTYIIELKIIIQKKQKLNYIYGISDFFSCSEKDVVIFNNINFLNYLEKNKAGLIILKSKYTKYVKTNYAVSEKPKLILVKLLKLCNKSKKKTHGFLNSIFVGKNSIIASTTKICGNVTIGNNTTIKEKSFISPGVIIGNNCIIGKNCFIKSNSIINDNTIINDKCIIGSNSTIGNSGFGFVKNDITGWQKIKHFGCVYIYKNVIIGNNTVIDKGVFLNTIISTNTIIDSNVKISHNVFIGENNVITGCTGIAGSTHIEKNCLIGGGTMISDHIFINNKTLINGTSVVIKSIKKNGIYSSVLPAIKSFKWNKNLYYLNNISKILKKRYMIV